MKRKCDTCGSSYEAKRSTSKYCSKKCNVRATRTRGKLVLVGGTDAPPAAVADTATGQPVVDAVIEAGTTSPAAGILASTRKELEDAHCVDTALGQVALHLAARLQYVPETGAGAAAVSRELRQVIAAAKASVTITGDALDDISKRRADKANAAT